MQKFFFFLPIYPIYGKKIFIALISRFFMEKRAQHIHEIKEEWGQTLIIDCFASGFFALLTYFNLKERNVLQNSINPHR